VEEMAAIFTEHANKLVEVANLACSMSDNDDGVKMVRYAASQIENLCPQVKDRLHKRRQLWLRRQL
jgi:catenin alpha